MRNCDLGDFTDMLVLEILGRWMGVKYRCLGMMKHVTFQKRKAILHHDAMGNCFCDLTARYDDPLH